MPTEEYFNQSDAYPSFETTDSDYDYVDDINGHFCLYEELPLLNIWISVLYYVIFIVGSLGNVFVILIMSFKEKRRRRLVDSYVINLAIADLIFVFSLPLWGASAARGHQWSFGKDLCKLSSYIIAVNKYSNIFFLTCLSIDRYLSIVKQLDFKHIRTQNYSMKISVAVWVTSMVLAIPSAYFRQLHQLDATYCKEDSTSHFYRGFSLIVICLTFVLPIVVILFCYCSILDRLRDHYVHSKKPLQRRENSWKIILAIVSGFVLSWLPFNIFKAIDLSLQFKEVDPSCRAIISRGLAIASCLAFINSCMNPIIYALLDQNFRLRTSRLSTCVFGSLRKRSNSFGSQSIPTESSTFAESANSKPYCIN
ncbi:putative G-protein coupled receptor 25 [Rhinoraja longicauda]